MIHSRTSFRATHTLILGAVLSIFICTPVFTAKAADAPAAQPTPAAQTNTTAAATPTDQTNVAPFVPLTQLPAIQDAASSNTLPNFLNQFYKICIGAGAVLAVLMIMIAGVQFMTSQGSVASNEKAKARMQNAVLGLILILSPTIVFSIINPDVLKLNLDFSKLQPNKLASLGIDSVSGQFSGGDAVLWSVPNGNRTDDENRCSLAKGTIEYQCIKNSVSSRVVGKSEGCASGETSYDVCKALAGSVTSGTQCLATYPADKYEFKVLPVNGNNNICALSKGSVSVPYGCCAGNTADSGNACCAQVKKYLLASYTINTAGRSSCYAQSKEFYDSETTCKQNISRVTSASAQNSSGSSISKPVVVESCTLTSNQNYIIPAPNNLPQC